jgi:hypothetical protein
MIIREMAWTDLAHAKQDRGPAGHNRSRKEISRGGVSPTERVARRVLGPNFLTESLNAAWLDPVALISSILDRSAEVIGASGAAKQHLDCVYHA